MNISIGFLIAFKKTKSKPLFSIARNYQAPATTLYIIFPGCWSLSSQTSWHATGGYWCSPRRRRVAGLIRCGCNNNPSPSMSLRLGAVRSIARSFCASLCVVLPFLVTCLHLFCSGSICTHDGQLFILLTLTLSPLPPRAWLLSCHVLGLDDISISIPLLFCYFFSYLLLVYYSICFEILSVWMQYIWLAMEGARYLAYLLC